MLNLLDIYARASRRLALTPGERAMLRTINTLLLAGLSGAAVAVLQAILAGGQPISMASLEQVAIYAATTAIVTGLVKLFRAQGDTLSLAVANALDQAEQRIPAPPQRPAPANAFAASQARRLAMLRASASATDTPNPARGDADTRPVFAAVAPTSATSQPQTQRTMAQEPATPAPAQALTVPVAAPVAAASEDEDDGPVTAVLAAVRPTAGAAAPPAPASPREWTC